MEASGTLFAEHIGDPVGRKSWGEKVGAKEWLGTLPGLVVCGGLTGGGVVRVVRGVEAGYGDDAVGAHAFALESKRCPRVLRGAGRPPGLRRCDARRRRLEQGGNTYLESPDLTCLRLWVCAETVFP